MDTAPADGALQPARCSRRTLLRSGLGALAAAEAARGSAADISRAAADPAYRIRNSGIRHSVMGWCFNPRPTPELARHAREIGLVGPAARATTSSPPWVSDDRPTSDC